MHIQITTLTGCEQTADSVQRPRVPDDAVSITGAAASLGIHGSFASTKESLQSPELDYDARVYRFALQAGARELVPKEAVRGCLRWPRGGAAGVEVLYTSEFQRASYSGLQTCGSVWLCPVCSAKISEHRREELGRGVRAWESVEGRQVALVTYTVRHHWADDLTGTLRGLLDARRTTLSGRAAKDFSRRFEVAGRVRALEVTHGSNGWHPHLHELQFLEAGADPDAMVAELRTRWAAAVERAGLRDVNDHGIDVRFADMTVAEYLSKYGRDRSWDREHELAKAVSKLGKRGNRTPAGLLADYTLSGDEKAGELWRHYARCFKGQVQLRWSKGLRDLLGLRPERTDEEVAAGVDAAAVVLAHLSLEQWRVVVGNDARAEVLQIASRGDAAALWLFLRALGC